MSVIISFAAVPKEPRRGTMQAGKSYTKNLSKCLIETKNYLEEFFFFFMYLFHLLEEGVILLT